LADLKNKADNIIDKQSMSIAVAKKKVDDKVKKAKEDEEAKVEATKKAQEKIAKEK
jgi:hypothetical protein